MYPPAPHADLWGMPVMCVCPSNPDATQFRGSWGRARPGSDCLPGIWPLMPLLRASSSHLPSLLPACCHCSLFLLPPLQTSCSPGPGQAGEALGVSLFLPAWGRCGCGAGKRGHLFCSASWLNPSRCTTHLGAQNACCALPPLVHRHSRLSQGVCFWTVLCFSLSSRV